MNTPDPIFDLLADVPPVVPPADLGPRARQRAGVLRRRHRLLGGTGVLAIAVVGSLTAVALTGSDRDSVLVTTPAAPPTSTAAAGPPQTTFTVEQFIALLTTTRPAELSAPEEYGEGLRFTGNTPDLTLAEEAAQERASWAKMNGEPPPLPQAPTGVPAPPPLTAAEDQAIDDMVAAARAQPSRVVLYVQPATDADAVTPERIEQLYGEMQSPTWGVGGQVVVLDKRPSGYHWLITKGGLQINLSAERPDVELQRQVELWLGDAVQRIAP